MTRFKHTNVLTEPNAERKDKPRMIRSGASHLVWCDFARPEMGEIDLSLLWAGPDFVRIAKRFRHVLPNA